MLEQAIGEAAGGDPTVQAGAALDSNREGIKACEQLLATAGDKAWRLLHHQLQTLSDHLTGLIQQLPMAIAHLAGTDQLLRLLTGHRQAACHELQIKALF